MILKAKIGFLWIFDDFRLRSTFQERTAPKSIEIDMEKLRMKFSAFIADFEVQVSIFYVKIPAHEGINCGTPVKVVILPLLASFS